MCFVRPNPDTPCVMWRTSVTSASFTASGVEGFVCCPAHAESYSRAKKNLQGKNSMTYIGCHTAQKGARAAVIGPWSEHSQRSWAKSEQRQMRRNGEKGRREKRKKERNKRNKGPSPLQYSRPPARAVNGKVMFATGESRGARGNADGRVSPIQVAAAVVAAAPLFLRFLSLSEVSAPPLPPSPPPEDTPRRSSLSLLRRCVPWSVVSASRCSAGCSSTLRTTCSGGGSSTPAGLRNLRGAGLWLIRDRWRLG